MTLAQFAEIFSLLAVQLRQIDADEATIRAYFDALKDIEPEFLAMAAKDLARSAEWFPKTSEWRTRACKIAQDRRDEQAALLRRLASPLCLACRDSGWALDAEHRAYRCECQKLRHLEVLGRRPWPTLIAAQAQPEQSAQTLASIKASVRGFPKLVKGRSA